MSLEDKSTWTKSKTWVLPVMVTVWVDDPTKYDSEMQIMIERLVNELKSIATHFDKSGKQLALKAGAPVKNIDNEEAQALLDVGFKNNLTEKEADRINTSLDELKALVLELKKEE